MERLFDTNEEMCDAGALAKGMSREEMVKTLRFPQYADLRNYNRISVFIEALHHLFTTGKPMFAYP